jgi:microcystin-dependent protein
MAVVIPNATDTTGGEEYAALDQAEPDSLDFEILGASGVNGVLSGCEVTTNGSAANVNVAVGTVVVAGISYDVSANAALALPTAPTDTRFDLVIYRVGTGLTTVQGVESTTNPVFPQSMSVFGGAFDGSIHIDFDTDVVLAACLRVASAVVTAKEIVDKRAVVTAQTIWQGSTLPSSAANGTTFFLTSEVTSGTGVTVSGLYVRANGTWLPIAQSNDSLGVPIGTTIMFNASTPPTGYLAEDGAAVSRTTYADLFAVIGTTFGVGDGSTTFNLPDSLAKMARLGSTPGNEGGADTITLTTSNLPSHTHTLGSHSHTLSHTHTIDHDHVSVTSGSAGSHSHSIDHNHPSKTSSSAGTHGHATEGKDSSSGGLGFQAQPTWSGVIGTGSLVALTNSTASGSFSASTGDQLVAAEEGAHTHTVNPDNYTGTSGTQSSHTHSVDLPSFSGSSGGASSTTTSTNDGDTGLAGSGNSFDNRPAYTVKYPMIRVL